MIELEMLYVILRRKEYSMHAFNVDISMFIDHKERKVTPAKDVSKI